jgi:hypothetical protein
VLGANWVQIREPSSRSTWPSPVGGRAAVLLFVWWRLGMPGRPDARKVMPRADHVDEFYGPRHAGLEVARLVAGVRVGAGTVEGVHQLIGAAFLEFICLDGDLPIAIIGRDFVCWPEHEFMGRLSTVRPG